MHHYRFWYSESIGGDEQLDPDSGLYYYVTAGTYTREQIERWVFPAGFIVMIEELP